MQVHHASFRMALRPIPPDVGKRLTEDDSEANLVAAAAPPEVGVDRRRLARRSAAAAAVRRTGTTSFRHRLDERRRGQGVDECLFAAACRTMRTDFKEN